MYVTLSYEIKHIFMTKFYISLHAYSAMYNLRKNLKRRPLKDSALDLFSMERPSPAPSSIIYSKVVVPSLNWIIINHLFKFIISVLHKFWSQIRNFCTAKILESNSEIQKRKQNKK